MKIYIGNLHINISQQDLYKLFAVFGDIAEVRIYVNALGKPSGSGYVIMKNDDQGHQAIEALNNINIMNRFLHIYEIKK